MSTATPATASARRGPSTRSLVVVGLLVSALLAGGLSFYASSHPDGLEHVATALGFDRAAQNSVTAGSPLADYAVADVADPRLAGGLAGLVGVIAVGLVMTGLLVVLRRRRPQTDSTS